MLGLVYSVVVLLALLTHRMPHRTIATLKRRRIRTHQTIQFDQEPTRRF